MADATEIVTEAAVKFIKYVRFVLPVDGFVFWIKADQLSADGLYNNFRYNNTPYNQAQVIVKAANEITVKGSVHFATRLDQTEEETFSTNSFVFTAEGQVNDLNAVGPTMMYLTEWMGVRFAFSSTDNFYQEAGIWHYHGNAVYADMATQILDNAFELSTKQVVSNSLPFWLSMNGYTAQPWEVFDNPVTFYPSYLLPLNLSPPFASVHIENPEPIQADPFYDQKWSRFQLVKETVRITTYGIGNDVVMDMVDFILQWTFNNQNLMSIWGPAPAIKDLKRPQVEFQTLAQKKVVEFPVNYYQTRARDIARQLIKTVVFDFLVDDIEFEQEVVAIPPLPAL